jgi:2-pyrone-4,6-dicarboxylate lactonase
VAEFTPPSFGTSVGLPHVNLDGREMPNDGDLLDLLAEWVPEAAVRNRILTQNAKALYGF